MPFATCAVLLALAASDAGAAPVPDQWRTPAERSGYETTPTLEETIAFLRRVAAAVPEMRLESLGTSPQGRPMPLVILSRSRAFTPEAAARAGLPVVMVQSGIHAGEIDGKDATLELLRDLALGRRRELLDAGTLLFVPVYNVDGHERTSPWNRPNQDGPRAGMGFRTTAAGYDLNRDWLKLQSAEARALVAAVNAWRPHLHVDVHVTDGVDHDWVLTTSVAEAPQMPGPVDAWVSAHLPRATAAAEAAGHRCGPYVDLLERDDPGKGFSSLVGGGRYSSGYFPLRNRPSVLIETHSYKPYGRRVAAVRDFLAALLAEVAREPRALLDAVGAAEAATVALGRPDAPLSTVVLAWQDAPPDTIRFPVYAWESAPSVVTGRPLLRYRRGEVHEITVPWVHRVVAKATTPRPRGYLVLPGWPQIEARLAGHGLVVRRLTAPVELEVETVWAREPSFAGRPYQGLVTVGATVETRRERRTVPAGALFVPADQPDFEVAAQLLEPGSPESLFAWGMLSTVLEQKEYIDGRNLEPLVEKLLADPAVEAEWQRALADRQFAADPQARRQWWYRRTPYWAVQEIGMVPVLRVPDAVRLPTAPWPAGVR